MKGRPVIVEYIRYTVPTDPSAEFEAAYAQAAPVLDADPHCLRWEVGKGVEEPEHYVVRIEWDSLDGHLQGFRRSAAFGGFFAAVRPFFDAIEEMKHYEVRAASGS